MMTNDLKKQVTMMNGEIAVEHVLAMVDQHSMKVQKEMNEQIWNEVEGQMDHVKTHLNLQVNDSMIDVNHHLVPMV